MKLAHDRTNKLRWMLVAWAMTLVMLTTLVFITSWVAIALKKISSGLRPVFQAIRAAGHQIVLQATEDELRITRQSRNPR